MQISVIQSVGYQDVEGMTKRRHLKIEQMFKTSDLPDIMQNFVNWHFVG